MTRLPPPALDDAVTWVGAHLDGLFEGPLRRSGRFTGGQAAADRALGGFSVDGYRRRRNEVWPAERRGASELSPAIRHGLLTLPVVWDAVADGPPADVGKFRDELLWQEYARHLYARLGARTRDPLRYDAPSHGVGLPPIEGMRCVEGLVEELEDDGWVVNQQRMWFASHWAVRHGIDWRDGEDWFYRRLLDGSRAANRLGWQWTTGRGTGKPYGFSRWQVEKRAPGLCDGCVHATDCPIADWPDDPGLERVEPDALVGSDPDPMATAGPVEPVVTSGADVVWLTAESLGDHDPALAANPDLPAVFVFDDPLLRRLRLSAPRLVYLAECLADLAARRPVEVHRGDPTAALGRRAVAATFTPVPGWHRRSRRVDVVEVHPWPWLRRPHGGSVASFSAWRKALGRPAP